MDRVILHCDLNNFFASVECLYNPKIRDFPVAVCGSQELRHGIVLAKNYHAKKFGIVTAEPIWKAKQKCPNLIVIKPNFNRYLKFSKLAKNIYKDYSEYVESFGIDECWLDVTGSINKFGNGEKLAYIIKDRIKNELGITASVGVSYNKIFAKLGSDYKKPDAVTVISKNNFKNIVWNLPIENLLYVGRATKVKLNNIGIYKIGEIAKFPMDYLKKKLGKCGETIWSYANGYDKSPVLNVEYEASVKGVGNSTTTRYDLTNNEEVKTIFYVLSESIAHRLRKSNLKGKTIQISIKDNDLNYIERQSQLESSTYLSYEIAKQAYNIFKRNWNWNKNIRALGIRITNLQTDDIYMQYSIFTNETKRQKLDNIEKCVDGLRSRFGDCSINRAVMLNNKLRDNSIEENIIHPFNFIGGNKNV